MLRPGGEPHANQIGKRGVANLELEMEPGLLADYGVALTRPSIASLAPVGALAPRLRRALRLRKRVASLLVERIALEILALVVTGARSRPDPRHSDGSWPATRACIRCTSRAPFARGSGPRRARTGEL